MVFISDNHQTVLSERKGKGIWQGLYQFPLVETEKSVSKETLQSENPTEIKSLEDLVLFNEKEIVHKLSHQHLHTKFWIVKKDNLQENSISWKDVEKYPVPILIANFLKNFNPSNGYF